MQSGAQLDSPVQLQNPGMSQPCCGLWESRDWAAPSCASAPCAARGTPNQGLLLPPFALSAPLVRVSVPLPYPMKGLVQILQEGAGRCSL